MDDREVCDRIEAIRTAGVEDQDDELAHSLEDKLHRDALRAIAKGHSNPSSLAWQVLETEHLDFARWCA